MKLAALGAEVEVAGHVYLKAFGREVFLKRWPGVPLRPHKEDHQDGTREVWCLGLYAVASRCTSYPMAAQWAS